jgi:hypothetical protein
MAHVISVYNPMQNSGKSTVALLLANALGMKYGYDSVLLLDGDATESGSTSYAKYNRRARMPKPFQCVDTAGWDQLDESARAQLLYVIFDTSRAPGEDITEKVKKASSIVIIPHRVSSYMASASVADDKSWQDGTSKAISSLTGGEGEVFVLMNNLEGGNAAPFANAVRLLNKQLLAEMPKMDGLQCLDNGHMPQYYNDSEAAAWSQVENFFNNLADNVMAKLGG